MACNGLKMGSFHLFVRPKWFKIIIGKTYFRPIFDPYLIDFWSQDHLFSRHFVILEVPK